MSKDLNNFQSSHSHLCIYARYFHSIDRINHTIYSCIQHNLFMYQSMIRLAQELTRKKGIRRKWPQFPKLPFSPVYPCSLSSFIDQFNLTTHLIHVSIKDKTRSRTNTKKRSERTRPQFIQMERMIATITFIFIAILFGIYLHFFFSQYTWCMYIKINK